MRSLDGRQSAPKGSNARRGAAAVGTSSGKRKGKGSGGGGKKPIKVLYIDNPMRVTTSAEGFRALVQELTGRHADPSKYSGGSAIDVDDYDSSGGSLQAEPQPGALPISPRGSTDGSSDATTTAAAAGQVPAQAPGFYDDDEESFMPQLIDNSYSVFSPPTFLYGHHSELI